MKNLSIILLIVFVLLAAVQSSAETLHTHTVVHKHATKKGVHSKVVVKTKVVTINHKKSTTVAPKPKKTTNVVVAKTTIKPLPGHEYIPPVKVDKDTLHIIKASENPAVQEEKEKEEQEKSGSAGTVTVVGLALVVAAAGGMNYRKKAKKQLNSPELFKYKFENNAIYDYTPKNSSLTYSFNPSDFSDFREEQPRINIYENSPSTSKRNSGSLSTEVIFEDATVEETRKFNITLPTNRAYKVVLPWDARCVDEIQLNCGDLVCIKECYQDGYSLGRNLTTRFDGIFPTCCLDNIGSSINQDEVNKWQSVGMYSLPKRSVKPTKKAKRASRGISLLTMPDWSKKLESLKLDSPVNNIF